MDMGFLSDRLMGISAKLDRILGQGVTRERQLEEASEVQDLANMLKLAEMKLITTEQVRESELYKSFLKRNGFAKEEKRGFFR